MRFLGLAAVGIACGGVVYAVLAFVHQVACSAAGLL